MFSKKFLRFIKIWTACFGIARSIDENVSEDPSGNPLPWYTYPAIEYLTQFDFSEKKVFEFGCANSSLFWAARAKKVVSVEDKQEWFDQWRQKFNSANLSLLFRSGTDYENSISEDNRKFDVIVIDGIRRAECAQTALKALSEEGMIIFDDSDRAETSVEYASALKILKDAGLLQVDFYGFCPMNIYPKTTSVFFTRNFDFPTINQVQPVRGIGSLWSLPRRERKELYKFQKEAD